MGIVVNVSGDQLEMGMLFIREVIPDIQDLWLDFEVLELSLHTAPNLVHFLPCVGALLIL